MNKGSEPYKIFVGGLNPDTTQESLSDYFSKYGELADKVVMIDGSGKPRCFGFVTYKDETSFQNCLNGRPHYVDDKQVDTKAAVPKGEHHGVRGGGGGGFRPQVEKVDKVFLGGLSVSTTEEDIKVALGYDKVKDVNIMKDGDSKPRGFGFATFKSCEDVEEILMGRMSVHIKIKDRDVEVKKARPQIPGGGGGASNSWRQDSGRGGYSGRGGRGGGGAGYGYQGYGPGGDRGGYQGNGVGYPGGGANYPGGGGGYQQGGYQQGGANYQGGSYPMGGYQAAAPYQGPPPPVPAGGGYYGADQTQTPPTYPPAGGYGPPQPQVPPAGPPPPVAVPTYGGQQQQQQQPPPQQPPPPAAQQQQQPVYAQGYDATAYGTATNYAQQPPAAHAPPAAPQAQVTAPPPAAGAYGQTPSNFGPTRGGMAGKPGGGAYHPYTRGGGR